jgi:hypothetical protein
MIVNSKQFSYDAVKKSFVAEMSSLSRLVEDVNPFDQIYPDSVDLGFTMISSRTSHQAQFIMSNYERNSEGEFLAWHLVPTKETCQAFPRLRGTTVTIFND